MAKPSTDEKDDADRDEADESAEADGQQSVPGEEAESSSSEAADERASDADADGESAEAATKGSSSAEEEGDDEDEDQAAAQLGIQRYVLAAFFTAGILGAYVLGKILHGIWAWASNKDWFHNTLPSVAAVVDEQKTNYATVAGALIALVVVIRTYRKPNVRVWADEVANELSKVKWPTRKEVSNSTIVVIAASAVATIYLALLDRLWSFVTDLFYGTGS
jgi:preprotein translocase subunit SecE